MLSSLQEDFLSDLILTAVRGRVVTSGYLAGEGDTNMTGGTGVLLENRTSSRYDTDR